MDVREINLLPGLTQQLQEKRKQKWI